jgi:hypothetical protein
MALDPKSLHPSVWAEIDRVVVEGYWGDGKHKKAIQGHSQVWMKEAAPGCAVWLGGLVAAVVAATFVAPAQISTPVSILATIMAIAVFALLVRHHSRQLSNAELRALAPGLSLSAVQKQYVDAVLILDDTKLGADSKREVIDQMNGLLDEEANLKDMRARSAGS